MVRGLSVVLPSLPEVNILLLNELEAGALLGLVLDENDPAPLISAARQILDFGVRDHVIVHSVTSCLYQAEEPWQPVSLTGAVSS